MKSLGCVVCFGLPKAGGPLHLSFKMYQKASQSLVFEARSQQSRGVLMLSLGQIEHLLWLGMSLWTPQLPPVTLVGLGDYL